MAIHHLTAVNAGSTLIVTFAFEALDGDEVKPNSIEWDLTDPDGNIVNNRSAVQVTPAVKVDILLTGDDLKAAKRDYNILTLRAVYDSDVRRDLPIREECIVPIINLVNVK